MFLREQDNIEIVFQLLYELHLLWQVGSNLHLLAKFQGVLEKNRNHEGGI